MRPRHAATGSSAASSSKSLIGAGPLERAEDDVIGIGGAVPPQEILALDGAAQRVEACAESRQPRVTVPDHLLERLLPNRSSRDWRK